MSSQKHANILQFPLVDDCLVVGGKPLPELAREIGTTPFYAYDRAAISARIRMLRTHLPEGLSIHYAVKANPMPELMRHVAARVDGLDVASGGELELALQSGVQPSQISFAGPGKSDPELSAALRAGIVINLESEGELQKIVRISRALGIRPSVAVRVNPDFELKASAMKMGGKASQFGIDAERVPDLLRGFVELDAELVGLHIYAGSQNLNADAIADAQQRTFHLASTLAEHFPAPLKTLNLGGGFGIPYFPGDTPLDLEAVGRNLDPMLRTFRKAMPDTEVIIELGRFIVGEAGVFVCRVIDRKLSRGKVFLITDGGLHHHLAASGNFGQVLRRNYPVHLAHRVEGGERELATVVGPLCTPLDLLADTVEMGKAGIGDLIVVLQSGAYGLTASPTAFLSHPPPKEILV